MKDLTIAFLSLICMYAINAQTVDDALRYSQNTYDITARSTGMGSSFGAMGGDFASASINPAGIGVYRSSEFLISPGLSFTTVKSGDLSKNNTSFIFSNISYVGSFKQPNSQDWKFLNFGIGFNRTNSFGRDYILQNLRSSTSLTDIWTKIANNEGVSNSAAEPAYKTNVITYNKGDEQYYSVLERGDLVNQQKVFTESGHMGEIIASFAGNYKDILYLGVSLGINSLIYDLTTTYKETSGANSTTKLDYYEFKEATNISGLGINFKAGAIFKPIHWLRIGAAIHSPSFYKIDDTYRFNILSHFLTTDKNGDDTYEYRNSGDVIEYSFRSPWKFIFSTATIISGKGAVNLDIGIINYSNANFERPNNKGYYDGTAQSPGVNRYITKQLTNVVNMRIGSEYKVSPDFSVRAGYGIYGNPFNTSKVGDIDLGYSTISAGLGYKNKNFSFDIAWQMYKLNDKRTFYEDSPSIAFETVKQQAKFSIGWRF